MTEDYQKILKERFHMSYLRPPQEMMIMRILENTDSSERSASITALPTGGGKSLCFLLPALIVEGYSILLYPLKSLMNDQARRLDELREPYSLIQGGMERVERYNELKALKNKTKKILITNMEMLLFLTESKSIDFMRGRTELFVMDEAHTIIDWRDEFRTSYRKLGEIIEYIAPHQALCFTATLSHSMKEELRKSLFPDIFTQSLSLSPDRENIFYHDVLSLNKREDIRRILTPPEHRPAVVFCAYRKECEEWMREFRRLFPSRSYHSGLPADEKKEIEEWFYHSDNGVIYSTNAYGMGVDKKNIRTVIHTRLPSDPLAFLQEAGRGGRDGEPFDSWVLRYRGETDGLYDIFSGNECIRAKLLDMTESGREEDRCSSCSHCVDDGYAPAGFDKLLLAHKLFFFLPSTSLLSILTCPLSGPLYMKGWSEREVRNALMTLKKNHWNDNI